MYPARIGAAFLVLLAWGGPAEGGLGLDTLETDDLTLVYRDPLQTYLVPHAARCFENALAFHEKLFQFTPSEPMTVLLNDFGDAGNASAGPVPRDLLLLETSPIGTAYETVSSNERMNWLMNHELVHIVTGDQAAHADRIARRLFLGKVTPVAENPESILWFYLTAPRQAAPRWYHEGLAVFLETWMAGGIGRAQGAWDEMVFRSMVRDGTRFQDPLSLVAEGVKIDFQSEVNSYLYGTRFLSYLAWRWSPEQVVEWAKRTDGSKRYFAGRFHEVFGEPLAQAWSEWVAWEQTFQEKNLAAIRQYPLTPVQDLGKRALGSISRGVLDRERGVIYAGVNYPGAVSHLAAISLTDGSVRHILDIKGPILFTVTSLAWDPESRKLFYTTDNAGYRDLWEVDPDGGEARMLFKDARIGDLVFDPTDGALWGVRHFNGIASIVRVPRPYTAWQRVKTFGYGEVPYDLDLSPDGKLLSASVGQVDGKHTLRLFPAADLQAVARGEGDPSAPGFVDEVDFGTALPLNFTFSPDGRYLYGSTYYTGVANVFRYDVGAKKLEAMSNAETGFFRPTVLEGDRLLVFRYTGAGFVPATIEAKPIEDLAPITFLGAEIVKKHPIVRDWKLGSPASIDLDSRVRERRPYQSWRRIGTESGYPVAQGYKETYALGWRMNLSDPLSLNRWTLVASYTPTQSIPDSERTHLDVKWKRYDWRAGATLNRADFYDLFGPTKTSRKGYSAGLGWGKTLIYDRPRMLRFDVDAAYFGNLEVLPIFQNVAAPSDKLMTAAATLDYSFTRSSLGSVDAEKGFRWELLGAADRSEGSTFPKLLGRFDAGLALPIPHSSVWLRTAAGGASGDRENSLASVYFGGFGNNWVDHGDVKRYRDVISFPGLGINEAAGQTFGKAMLEWNLPPLRFAHFGTPAAYASWLRSAIFVSGLVTDPDESAFRKKIGNAGAQVDLRFSVLSRLDMTFSLGWAVAYEDGVAPRREGMISLKILE
ncbi:MAG TPA: hypothetical protein VFV75_10080 [Candidatus Polarisedimenticolaceae bacterium]|nr:hypothetical protein [Candidatus Polarisedimenticolaceae bacterium]